MRKIMSTLFGVATLASAAVAQTPAGLNLEISREDRAGTLGKDSKLEADTKSTYNSTAYKAAASYSVLPEVAVGGFVGYEKTNSSDNGSEEARTPRTLELGVEVTASLPQEMTNNVFAPKVSVGYVPFSSATLEDMNKETDKVEEVSGTNNGFTFSVGNKFQVNENFGLVAAYTYNARTLKTDKTKVNGQEVAESKRDNTAHGIQLGLQVAI